MQYAITSEASIAMSFAVGIGGQISNPTANVGIGNITLCWTKSQDPAIARYNVYYSTSPVGYTGTGLSYVGNSNPQASISPIWVPTSGNSDASFIASSPSILISGLIPLQPYWFQITAVDQNGNESAPVEITDANGSRINLTTKSASGNMDIRIPTPIKPVVTRTTSGVALTWYTGY